MTTIDLTPGSPEWCRRVSPSKAAAILGVSPWDSQRAMYHKMRGEAPWDEESEAMERGNLCEPAVLAWWRKHHEHGEWAEQPAYTVDDWCVATPDAVTDHEGRVILVEAKTAANMDEWGEPGTDVIPSYYLVQVYLAMEVARRNGVMVEAAHVPVLGGYRLLFSNYIVEYDAAIGRDLMARMEAWRDLLCADAPPPLDDSLATFDVIRKIHPDIDAGESVELTYEDARELLRAVNCLDQCEAATRIAKATVLDQMGRAQYATCNGVRVARRQPNKSGVSFVPLPKSLPLLEEIEGAA